MRVWLPALISVAAFGATIAADTLPATGGNIEVTPMTHAHVQVEFGGKVAKNRKHSLRALCSPVDNHLIASVKPGADTGARGAGIDRQRAPVNLNISFG